jgi:molecular chaperone Hsp33
VAQLLGEMTAAAALLSTSIKFNGSLIFQIHGDGPVRLLVVECRPDLTFRATAELQGQAVVPDGAGLRELVNAHGRGRCAITLDPRDPLPGQQPYQGVVSLDGTTIGSALENYMRRSEQLDTRLWLAASRSAAAGMLLQRLPKIVGTGAEEDDTWHRAATLASTLSGPELLAVEAGELVHRLYGQERLNAVASLTPRFQCTCSRTKIGRMLLSLGRDEVDSIIEEIGVVSVTCEFCKSRHRFDAVDVGELFATGTNVGAGVNPPQ